MGPGFYNVVILLTLKILVAYNLASLGSHWLEYRCKLQDGFVRNVTFTSLSKNCVPLKDVLADAQ